MVDAGRGLGEASANITDLAAATKAAVESLNYALSAFRVEDLAQESIINQIFGGNRKSGARP